MPKTAVSGKDEIATAARLASPAQTAAKNRLQLRQYLNTSQGKAELHEALIDIHAAQRETRISGAKKLAELKPAEAFSPLLDVLQKEKDPEIRIMLLKAIRGIAAEPPFSPLFRTAIEPLKSIILNGGDVKEAVQAIYAIQHCIADYRPDISEFMYNLSNELESRFSRDDARSAIASRVASSIEED